jgi:hypothetical protein
MSHTRLASAVRLPLLLAAALFLGGGLGACSDSDDGSKPGGAGGGSASGGRGGSGGGSGGASGSGGQSGSVGTGGSSPGSGGGSGGSAGGTGGGTVSGGSGGSSVDGARTDSGGETGPTGDTGGPGDGSSSPDLGAVQACPRPSVDRLEIWTAHGGSLRPAVGGNLLVKEGDRYYAKVEFLPGGEWHEIVVPLVNSLMKQVDLTNSKGLLLSYSATAELWVQLRPLSKAHGGDQHTALIPSTGGMVKELFLPFNAQTFGVPLLGAPAHPFSQTLRDANFFNFVGRPAVMNTFVVRGLRIDGHLPPCSP